MISHIRSCISSLYGITPECQSASNLACNERNINTSMNRLVVYMYHMHSICMLTQVVLQNLKAIKTQAIRAAHIYISFHANFHWLTLVCTIGQRNCTMGSCYKLVSSMGLGMTEMSEFTGIVIVIVIIVFSRSSSIWPLWWTHCSCYIAAVLERPLNLITHAYHVYSICGLSVDGKTLPCHPWYIVE